LGKRIGKLCPFLRVFPAGGFLFTFYSRSTNSVQHVNRVCAGKHLTFSTGVDSMAEMQQWRSFRDVNRMWITVSNAYLINFAQWG
jgi:hypothetical protein